MEVFWSKKPFRDYSMLADKFQPSDAIFELLWYHPRGGGGASQKVLGITALDSNPFALDQSISISYSSVIKDPITYTACQT